jgi:hypothetical protein
VKLNPEQELEESVNGYRVSCSRSKTIGQFSKSGSDLVGCGFDEGK